MQNKKSFILHLDSLNVLDDLDNNQIAELFIAMRDYNLGKEVKLSGLMKAVFTSFKNQFDRDLDKYNAIVERNKINGQKGGRPKKQNNPLGFLETQRNPEKPKKADSDNDNDSVNGSDSKKEIIYNIYPNKCHSGRSTSKSKKKDLEKISKLLKEHSFEHLEKVINYYIEDCKKTNTYIKNFSTFLNNLPDIPEETQKKKFIRVWKFGQVPRDIPIEQWTHYYNQDKTEITKYKEVWK
jgi:hypothetical protein